MQFHHGLNKLDRRRVQFRIAGSLEFIDQFLDTFRARVELPFLCHPRYPLSKRSQLSVSSYPEHRGVADFQHLTISEVHVNTTLSGRLPPNKFSGVAPQT